MKNWSNRTFVWIALGMLAVGLMIVVIGGSPTKDTGQAATSAPETTSVAKTTSVPKTTAVKPPSDKQKLEAALSDASPPGAGQVKVDTIEYGKSLNITLKTPEGGFEGASIDDLNNSMAATAEAVYGVAKYPATKELVVAFRGGLVDTETGKDLPKVNTAIYTLPYSKARQIDWADEDSVYYSINWSNYNDFTHPAIKSD